MAILNPIQEEAQTLLLDSHEYMVEEGLPVADLWEILESIKQIADQWEVDVVTGDTKVVDRGKGDKLFINTSGIGQVQGAAEIGARTGTIGCLDTRGNRGIGSRLHQASGFEAGQGCTTHSRCADGKNDLTRCV